jgi:cobalamin biosynthesis protein CobT
VLSKIGTLEEQQLSSPETDSENGSGYKSVKESVPEPESGAESETESESENESGSESGAESDSEFESESESASGAESENESESGAESENESESGAESENESESGAESEDESNSGAAVIRSLGFRFASPMIYDLLGHLGDADAETEIKYLSLIPLNGDPFVFIPGAKVSRTKKYLKTRKKLLQK